MLPTVEMTPASADEIAELLGERAEESIVERVANVGASIEEVRDAVEDLDFEVRFGEERTPASPRVKEVRTILEELPYFEDLVPEPAEDEDEELQGLTVIDGEESSLER